MFGALVDMGVLAQGADVALCVESLAIFINFFMHLWTWFFIPIGNLKS